MDGFHDFCNPERLERMVRVNVDQTHVYQSRFGFEMDSGAMKDSGA